MRFILKEGANPNYLATICKIGQTYPIEGADRIQRTVVNGYDMVISKDVKEGDIVVYIPIETAICEKFLSANNLYELGEWKLNSNALEVGELVAESNRLMEEAKKCKKEGHFLDYEDYKKKSMEVTAEAKKKVGFFNKRGRVRILTLRRCPSLGFIASVDSIIKYKPDLEGTDWESLVGTQFNYIDEDEFCWKYMPPMKVQPERDTQKRYKKSVKKIKKFDRIIPDTFLPHYDTQKLNERMAVVMSPNDMITITIKLHGTSIILSNIPVLKELSLWDKIKKFFGIKVVETEYDNIYSSRRQIKNRYINPSAGDGFYEVDVYGCVNRDFGKFIPKDCTIYGEVVGYEEGSEKMIQKDHDYGCKVGEWKFMPYRIVNNLEDGKKYEWNVDEVYQWTEKLIADHPEIADKVMPLQILYHGRFKDLYPDIDVAQHWHENVLERLKNDKDKFGMELKEPLCHLYEAEAKSAKALLDKAITDKLSNKIINELTAEYEKWEAKRAPREGLVFRKDNDPLAEAWKLKTNAHYHREAEQHDSGEIDMEEIG